jgi:CarD family transcriptional regulator
LGYGGTTVLVPFSNASNVGLRRVIKNREISRILSFLSNGWCAISPDWKVRSKQNREKLQGGDLLKAAEVFKSLLQVQLDKPLSFHEKGLFDRARHMLASEISIARNVAEVRAVKMLERALAKAGIALPGQG